MTSWANKTKTITQTTKKAGNRALNFNNCVYLLEPTPKKYHSLWVIEEWVKRVYYIQRKVFLFIIKNIKDDSQNIIHC